jgi:hypothetical protein
MGRDLEFELNIYNWQVDYKNVRGSVLDATKDGVP